MNSKSGLILDGIGTWGLICNKKNRVTEFSVHWDCFYCESLFVWYISIDHKRVLERLLWQLRVLRDFGRLAEPEIHSHCLFTEHLCCILCLKHLVSERSCLKTTSHERYEGFLAALFTSMEKETRDLIKYSEGDVIDNEQTGVCSKTLWAASCLTA